MAGLEGITFGPYHLKQLLGRGGMADVYLAYDEAMDRDVAIKVMSTNSAGSLERFRREAEAIDKLCHEHILSVFDYDDEEPWHYMAMLYAPGGTLSDLLQTGPLTPDDTGEILDQIASALQCAHDHGVIHRDIKPSNILLRDPHYVYLADFGVAKMLSSSGEITQTGTLMGTPEYMAPDLAEGPATPGSDIYALGVLLYRMIAGRVPFSGSTPMATYWKQMHEKPVPPSHVNPALSPMIDRVVLRALEKDPHKRFQRAQELAEAYRQALNGQIIEDDYDEAPFYEERDVAREVPVWSVVRPVSTLTPLSRQRVIVHRHKHTPSPIVLPPLPLRTTEDDQVAYEPITSLSMDLIEDRNSVRETIMPPVRRRSAADKRVAISIVVAGLLIFIALPMSYIYHLYATSTKTMQAPAVSIQQSSSGALRQIQDTSQMNISQGSTSADSTLALPSGEPILTDSLSSNGIGRWQDDGLNCYFAGGSYRVNIKRDNSFQPCGLLTGPIGNVAVQVDVSLLSGSYVGMLLRSRGDQFYIFGISNQGQFFFSRHDAGSGANYVPLIQATTSNAILPGGAKNTLLVVAHQDSFKLYINGTFVGQAQDGTYANGQFALVAGTLPPVESSQASFTNLKMFSN